MRWVSEQVAPALESSAFIVLDNVDGNGLFKEFVRTTDRSWFIFRTAAVPGLTETPLARDEAN